MSTIYLQIICKWPDYGLKTSKSQILSSLKAPAGTTPGTKGLNKFEKSHFQLSRANFERFFESCAPDVVPAGAFGSWEIDFWDFSSPLFRVSCPQGPFGSWKIDFWDFSSPLSRCRARRGLWGAGNLTFSIFQALCPVVVPAGAFWELKI